MLNPELGLGLGMMMIAVAFAIGISAGLSAIAQGWCASTAVVAVTEKDYSFGKLVTLVALPETQAIYGFVIAILIIFVVALGSGFFG